MRAPRTAAFRYSLHGPRGISRRPGLKSSATQRCAAGLERVNMTQGRLPGTACSTCKLGSGGNDGQVLADLFLHLFGDFSVGCKSFYGSRLERRDWVALAIQAGQRPIILLCRNGLHNFDAITVLEINENHSCITIPFRYTELCAKRALRARQDVGAGAFLSS